VAQAVLGRKSQIRGYPQRHAAKQAGGEIQAGDKRGEQDKASTTVIPELYAMWGGQGGRGPGLLPLAEPQA